MWNTDQHGTPLLSAPFLGTADPTTWPDGFEPKPIRKRSDLYHGKPVLFQDFKGQGLIRAIVRHTPLGYVELLIGPGCYGSAHYNLSSRQWVCVGITVVNAKRRVVKGHRWKGR